tara:strand:- start:2536 stop:3276 length:741 start_codon:yes stop_codon:yes gene_type:complete
MDNKFIIISACYNVEKWIGKSITSVLRQTYKNYVHVIVDDMSTDRTPEAIQNYVEKSDKIVFVRNKEKKCSLENIHDAIKGSAGDDDIVVILDGDDFLAAPNVLENLNKIYNENKCWLTYGSYMNLSDRLKGKFSKKLPDWVIDNNSYRDYSWCTSHLRTFKGFLFNSIKDEDFKNSDGQFYDMAGDLVIMFPMLEMSGHNSLYIDDVLYIWNDLNVLNEHKVNNTYQMNIEKTIRGMKKYNVINE